MTLEQLRLIHPRLVYKRFEIEITDRQIVISYEFLLEPDIVFRPTVTIPFTGHVDLDALTPYAFYLGMVEAISYWKAACPKELVVEAGTLTDSQIRFWRDLFIHGLGEFFYRNDIDFTDKDFFEITCTDTTGVWKRTQEPEKSGDLVLVGGGKDSAVALKIMKKSNRTIQTMVLNPTESALRIIQAAGYPGPIVVHRTLDHRLIALNNEGYLNGHTPFSAYLAFLGTAVAIVYGRENVIVANEKSADEGNVTYLGMEINHQYSKSFRFEQSFRQYITSSTPVSDPPNYFSVLRPLNDLQIGKLFAEFPEYFPIFRSCNVGSRSNTWCGKCPKCAFTYLILFPFLSFEQMMASFGGDLFTRESVIGHIRAMVGLTEVKPFECVGTRDEARLAVLLVIHRCVALGREVPEGILAIKSDAKLTEADMIRLTETTLRQWGDTYNLPADHLTALRDVWKSEEGGV